MEDELRYELGATLVIDHNPADDKVRLAQYELPPLGHKFICPLTNKSLQRYDLPTLSDETSTHSVSSSLRKLGEVSLYQSDGNDFFSDWFQFSLELVEESGNISQKKFKAIDPTVLNSLELSWRSAFQKARELRELVEPPIQPVVDIAKNAWPTLQNLLRSPRKLLKRERELVSLERLNEIDEGCIRWMVRQSGRTLAERAGSSQKLLGVVRKDDFDTIENRVVNDLALKIDSQSRDYSSRYKSFSSSDRYVMVKNFGKVVSGGRKISSVNVASPLQVLPKPNFVLQFDPLYSKAWQWYLQLISRKNSSSLQVNGETDCGETLYSSSLTTPLLNLKNSFTKNQINLSSGNSVFGFFN